MYEIVLTNNSTKDLKKIEKGDKRAAFKINLFLKRLATLENPFAVANAKKLSSYEDRWRWRVGIHYRVVACEKTIS